jgi:hypothetical protein
VTDASDADLTRLEQILDRLERIGMVLSAPPSPDQHAAVGADGYPQTVVSGELIEAAWGNAVVD